MNNLYFTTALVLTVFPIHSVMADGPLGSATNGEYGVNRRILTKNTAFSGVKGTFTVPSPHIVDPVSIYKPKPTFYLGASQKIPGANALEVDAGFQWEPEVIRKTVGTVNMTFLPGWTVFINSKSPAGAGPVGANGWRCGIGTDNPNVSSVELRWVFFRRSTSTFKPSVGPKFGGYLYVNAIGAEQQPSSTDLGPNKFLAKILNTSNPEDALTDSLSAMRVKRVVGITQNTLGSLPVPGGGVYDEDGTTLTGLIYSQGQVTQANPLVGPFGPNYSPAGWTTWDDTNTELNGGRVPGSTDFVPGNPGGTGFFPGGKDLTLRHLRLFSVEVKPTYVTPTYIEEPITGNARGARDVFIFNSETDRAGSRPGRYSNEDIDVSLRRFIPIGGLTVGPGF